MVHFPASAVAADPSRPGHFAMMTVAEKNTVMQVHLTDDYGKTWKGPLIAGSVPDTTISKPDMAFSPKGVLSVMWLAVNRDNSYTAWANSLDSVSGSFGKQARISQAASPARSDIAKRGNNWDGDDLSSLAVDDEYVHVVWADGRAGFLGAWYARLPLEGFK